MTHSPATHLATRSSATRALLVYPRFAGTSFWNYRDTCELMGARYSAAPLGLITVAALLPPDWSVRLVDRNIEDLRQEDLAWADLVLTGGMLPQRRDALELIRMARSHGKPVVVGGPDATSSPEVYAAADFQVLGEAEEVMAEFLARWSAGDTRGVFAARDFPDIRRSPVPRFDLLKLEHYLHVGVQYSRGCPFECEFCNVIELNGRAPRTKASSQLFRELDSLFALGYRGHVDFVDDNLIGNRKAAKSFLRELKGWLDARGRPFEFTTEASLNLADDDQLLGLMRESNFFAIFVGIESPDPAALLEANKKQNARRDIVASIRKIHRAGIFVNAGFIIGFDSERDSVAPRMVDCIEAAGIPVCMVGLLYALAGTQLSRRLLAEGRLRPDARPLADDDADQCTSGLNFVPRRARAEVLRDYQEVIDRLYSPAAYFARVRRVGRELDRSAHSLRPALRNVLRDLRAFSRMAWRMGIRDRDVRLEWWHSLLDCLLHNPAALKIVMTFAALYAHLGPYSRGLVQRLERQIAEAVSEPCARPLPRLQPSPPEPKELGAPVAQMGGRFSRP
jgi:radical SAM superfamily enzyme YgiQ (UPF0313 family)